MPELRLDCISGKAQIPLGSSRHMSNASRRAVLFDKLDTDKTHGLDTSNVSRRDEPIGIRV